MVKAASQGATRADRLRLPAGTFPAPSPRSVVAYVRHDPRWFIATRTEPDARPVPLGGETREMMSLASGLVHFPFAISGRFAAPCEMPKHY